MEWGLCLGLARLPCLGASVLDAGLSFSFGHAARNGRLIGGRSALSSILNRTASLEQGRGNPDCLLQWTGTSVPTSLHR